MHNDALSIFFFFWGLQQRAKDTKLSDSDEVSSCRYVDLLLLRRITQRKSRGELERSLCWDPKYFLWPRRYAALQNWWLQDRNSSGPDYFLLTLRCNILSIHSFNRWQHLCVGSAPPALVKRLKQKKKKKKSKLFTHLALCETVCSAVGAVRKLN